MILPALDDTSDATLSMPYTSEPIAAQTVAIDYAVEAKHLVLIFMRLVYIDGGGKEIEDERWRCGGIVGTRYQHLIFPIRMADW